jgi:hypothetical protein
MVGVICPNFVVSLCLTLASIARLIVYLSSRHRGATKTTSHGSAANARKRQQIQVSYSTCRELRRFHVDETSSLID